jgi:Flp pilus assembly protein TadG
MKTPTSGNVRGSDPRKCRYASRGQAVVELAIAVPMLIVLLLTACDFARVQYGAQSLITAADTGGMITAATSDAMDVAGVTAIATPCTCISGTGSPVAVCPSSYCSASPKAAFVEVDTQAPFHTLFNFMGLPTSITVTGKAVMQVAS